MRSSIFFIFLVFHSYFSFAQSADEIQKIEKHFDEILQKEEYYQQQKIETIQKIGLILIIKFLKITKNSTWIPH